MIGDASNSILTFSCTMYTPQYLMIPDTSLSNTTYNINSRPASISGDYGIIGDDGKIIKVEGNSLSIVNETNNTYYNPATGQTSPVTDWTYDYSDRSYNLTLESGDTATVTYGDENLTIVEGDTVYNVYYLTDSAGETPVECSHNWTETSAASAAWNLFCMKFTIYGFTLSFKAIMLWTMVAGLVLYFIGRIFNNE